VPSGLRGHVLRAFAASWLTLGAACTGRPSQPGPESIGPFRDAPVILISIDTLRADHLALYGYKSGSTPTLDALGAAGIVFEECYSHTPLTLPSHASLLTGLLPTRHGVRDNIGFTLGTADTLAARFKAAGYATGAAVSAYVLRHQTGVAQGFDFFDDAIEVAGSGESLSASQRDGRLAVDALASWIDRQPTSRVFAFLHLYEPHTPYAPPATHQLPQPYDGEIAYADELVGRFLDRLRARNLADAAIISVVSDHGEGLNDHGESEHGIFLYREALHVPWMLRLPRPQAKRRISGPAGLVDVSATLLDLAGVRADALDGHSLAASLQQAKVPDRTVYSETYYPRLHFGWSDLASAVDGRYHYIRAPRAELFDLSTDPGERRNLAGAQASTASALNGWIAKAAADAKPTTPADVPADVRERLKALGYVGSAPATPASGSALPDPKEMIASYETLKQGLALASDGRDADAVKMLEPLARANPAMLDAWEALAKSLERTGRTADAIAAFRKVLDLDPLKPETHLALARIYALARQPGPAREHAAIAATRDPAAANETLAELALDAGQRDEAAALARKSADADPSRYMPQFLLGVVAQQRGRCDEAIPFYQRAIELKRSEPAAVVRNLHAGLADCLARAGRTAEAQREFAAEIEAIPSSPEARVGLATLYRSLNRDAEAREVLGGLVAATPGADASTYWTVVRAFTMLGDAEAARDWKTRARARFPDDPRFR
jgi:arylsulfatase A-like enzyme/Tfp pilus assembly protein PilF